MEIPKTMIVEKIQGSGGAEKAAAADKELPDKVDTDAELLKKYDIDPKELTEDFEDQSLVAG